MHNFIVFSNSDRLNSFVSGLYMDKPELKNLDDELLISIEFPICNSKVHFVYDGIGLFENVKQNLYDKISALDNDGRIFVCFHAKGDIYVQNAALERLSRAEYFTSKSSHSAGLYRVLDSWYKGETSVETVLQNYFFLEIRKYRNRIVEHLFVGQLPSNSLVNFAQMNNSQKEFFEIILKKGSNLTNGELEAFKNTLKNLDS